MPSIREANVKLGPRERDGRRRERWYIIRSAADEDEARDYLLDNTPGTLGSMTRSAMDCRVSELIEEECWLGVAVYATPEFSTPEPQPSGSFSLSFDISGQNQRIMRSRETVASYPEGAPNFGGALNVNADGTVEGSDIIVPVFSFTVNYTIPDSEMSHAYIRTMAGIVGTVNGDGGTGDGEFLGFESGELLLTKVTGLQRGSPEADWDLGFTFSVSFNEEELVIGPTVAGSNITIAEKKGWDYLWVHYGEYEDATNHVTHKRPKYAYVEAVYRYTNFADLGISGV